MSRGKIKLGSSQVKLKPDETLASIVLPALGLRKKYVSFLLLLQNKSDIMALVCSPMKNLNQILRPKKNMFVLSNGLKKIR